jgi:hypothetical protein
MDSAGWTEGDCNWGRGDCVPAPCEFALLRTSPEHDCVYYLAVTPWKEDKVASYQPK